MEEGFERLLGGVAAAVVEVSRRRARLVVALSALLTAGSVWLAASILEIDTDSDRLLSAELRVRQTNLALAETFPELQNNLVVMVEADDPADARAAAEELRGVLAREPERYPGIFLPGHGAFYDDFGLLYLERDDLDELSRRIEEAGPLLATLAERPELPILLAALSHVVGSVEGLAALGDDGLRILEELAHTVEGFDRGERARIPWDDLLFEDVGAASYDNPQLLFVRPAGDLTRMEPVLDALEAIRAHARDLEPRPGLRVRITGDRAVHTEEMSLVIGEAILAGAASLVVVTLLLWVCLGSLRLLAVTLLTLIVGLAWTAGLAALAVGHLNAVTSAFAVLYIGLGVDYGIHFALGYLEQRGLGRTPEQALRDTGSQVGSSLLFCALTTATGFYAFIPTAYRAVGDMGIICGTGVFLGLAATLALYPALIALGIGEPRRVAPRRLPLRLPTFPLRWPRLVCAVTAAVTAASLASLAWIRFDLNTLNVRDPRVESVQALKDLLLESERSPWTIEVLAQDLEEARELAARLEGLDGVKEVHTIESFVPEDQAARLAVLARMRSDLTAPIELGEEETGETLDRLEALKYTIEGFGVALDIDAELGGGADDGPLGRASERLRAALLDLLGRLGEGVSARDLDALEEDVFGGLPDLLQDVLDALPRRAVSLADLPGDLAGRYLAPDGRARVVVFSSANLDEPGALERFSDLVRGLRPDAGGPAAGTVALGRAIVDSLRQALTTAVVVITLLLMILWRSLRATLLTLTPLAVGALTTAAASVVLDVPLNFANIIVLPLILGIGVDSGIHLVHRHRLGLLGSGNLLETSTARAVLFSALTTVGSFATLGFSNHLGIASLGRLLTIGVVLMLVANVVVLPAVLTLVDRRRGQPAPPATRL